MKRGLKSLKLINKFYHEINRKSSNLILFEHNFMADENAYILVNLRDDCYTYTWESIDYTIEHSEDYKWFKLAIMR